MLYLWLVVLPEKLVAAAVCTKASRNQSTEENSGLGCPKRESPIDRARNHTFQKHRRHAESMLPEDETLTHGETE